MKFEVVSKFSPSGDQPTAIKFISNAILRGEKNITLLGVTGSGKTYTMAKVIENIQKPTLILAPNKTLAAQLYSEMKGFFPHNAVEYFVSYYDYYQPEAYIPKNDIFIDKEATINDEIDRLRHSATRSLLERKDVIVVASVSCIYGIGSPDEYTSSVLMLRTHQPVDTKDLLKKFVKLQYDRSEYDLKRGTFRMHGDTIEISPAHLEDIAWRISLEWEEIENIEAIDVVTGKVIQKLNSIHLYPNTHFLMNQDRMSTILNEISLDLREHIERFESQGKLIEAQRIKERVNFDLEMLKLTGHCRGIENYSRYLTGREPGMPPPTLFEYLPKDALLFVDESHVSVPQIGGMYKGDAARKNTLAEYGFRLEACRDNRPLKFEEWDQMRPQTVFVSATPSKFEFNVSGENVTEQVIRPTGLVDPICIIQKTENQIDDLIARCRDKIAKKQRILVTTLTKRMAESLSEYLSEVGISTRYMHSDIETLERIELIKELRLGSFDVLVGINLLREGLDIPECSLIAILDADKEGFLRSETSLIQTIGRAARNVEGEVVLYADIITNSMKRALDETERRRKKQIAYNLEHNITPKTIQKNVEEIKEKKATSLDTSIPKNIEREVEKLEKEMKAAAKNLEFERAAKIRDRVKFLKSKILEL